MVCISLGDAAEVLKIEIAHEGARHQSLMHQASE